MERAEVHDSLDKTTLPVFSGLLEQYGFRKLSEFYDQDHFDNAFVIFDTENLRLRFVRDRSFVFVEVGPSGMIEDWHRVEDVLDFVDQPSERGKESGSVDLVELARRLAGSYRRVEEVFSSQARLASLQQWEEARDREAIRQARHRTKRKT